MGIRVAKHAGQGVKLANEVLDCTEGHRLDCPMADAEGPLTPRNSSDVTYFITLQSFPLIWECIYCFSWFNRIEIVSNCADFCIEEAKQFFGFFLEMCRVLQFFGGGGEFRGCYCRALFSNNTCPPWGQISKLWASVLSGLKSCVLDPRLEHQGRVDRVGHSTEVFV